MTFGDINLTAQRRRTKASIATTQRQASAATLEWARLCVGLWPSGAWFGCLVRFFFARAHATTGHMACSRNKWWRKIEKYGKGRFFVPSRANGALP